MATRPPAWPQDLLEAELEEARIEKTSTPKSIGLATSTSPELVRVDVTG